MPSSIRASLRAASARVQPWTVRAWGHSRLALARVASLMVVGTVVPLAMHAEAQAQMQAPTRPSAARASCPPPTAAPTSAQVQRAQRDARDRGFLWRITKDGRTSHLYGTMHVGKVGWMVPGPQLREALMASDTLALELDSTDPKIQQAILRAAAGPGPSLPAAVRQRLSALRDAACLPADGFDRLHPVMQLMTLSMAVARREGLDAAFGSEPVLTAHAKAAGRAVVSLETPQRQMQALIPADKVGDQAALVVAGLEQLEANRIRPALQRMSRAWESGNVAEIENHGEWCDCVNTAVERDLYQRINDGRNPGMAQAIDALHRRGNSVLAAVGALHMTGKASLPKLMAERGYKVERVAMDAR